MFRRLTPVLLAGLAVAACSSDRGARAEDASSTQAAAPSADEAALEQIRADYAEHYNQHHAAEVAALYSDSAFVLSSDMSVNEGRAEVQKVLETELADSPTLALTTKGTKVFGDHAVAIGEYTVDVPQGGQANRMAGSYLTLFQRENGQWKIRGLITNLSAPPPEGFKLAPEEKTPEDQGTMKDMVSRFTADFNAGNWAALAGHYTADAQVAYSTAPFIQGPAAIQQRYETRFGTDAAPGIVIHDVGTMPLDQDWAVDGGWFTVKASPASGAFTQDGMYMNLMQRQPDGSWKIHWSVTSGYPKPASATPPKS